MVAVRAQPSLGGRSIRPQGPAGTKQASSAAIRSRRKASETPSETRQAQRPGAGSQVGSPAGVRGAIGDFEQDAPRQPERPAGLAGCSAEGCTSGRAIAPESWMPCAAAMSWPTSQSPQLASDRRADPASTPQAARTNSVCQAFPMRWYITPCIDVHPVRMRHPLTTHTLDPPNGSVKSRAAWHRRPEASRVTRPAGSRGPPSPGPRPGARRARGCRPRSPTGR